MWVLSEQGALGDGCGTVRAPSRHCSGSALHAMSWLRRAAEAGAAARRSRSSSLAHLNPRVAEFLKGLI